MLLVVANPGGADGGTTVNLLAPIVVNARTSVGAQLILEEQDLPLRAELAAR
jgi:flagellar assembly factor FliW